MLNPIAEINLQNIASNTDYINSLIAGKNLFPVVKANAYGHGLVRIVEFLNKLNNVNGFCVATPDEAETILSLKIQKPIFILGKFNFEEIYLLDNKNVIPTIHSFDDLEKLKRIKNKGINSQVQVKIDTGMGRMGFDLEELHQVIDDIILYEFNVIGLWSHLSSAGERDSKFTTMQIEKFNYVISSFSEKGIDPNYIHLANSSGILFHPKSHYNTVRPGLSIYGISPNNEINSHLKPVMKFKSPLIKINSIKANHYIGYNRKYKTTIPERIGIFQGGYADGIDTCFNNNGNVAYNGSSMPIRGKVSMDMIAVDLQDLPINVGDYATIWGDNSLKLENLAKKYNKIPYEFLVNLSDRVERVYL